MVVLMDTSDDIAPVGRGTPAVHDRLEDAMERAERHGGRLAVLHVHLDLEAGADPEALRGQVALRLAGALRATDSILPGGSDWLLLLLPGVDSVGDAAIVARKVLGVLAEPFAVDDRSHRLDGRIGMAIYPDHGFNSDALLRNAEEAMRRAGTEGGPGVRWHAPRSTVTGQDDLAS
jgi:predicted signal transduction protein with EAL and GGDEF domain